MNLFTWAEEKTQKMHWYDMSVFKLCMIAFTLGAAKLFPVLLTLDWYWYGGVFVVTYAWLLYAMFLR